MTWAQMHFLATRARILAMIRRWLGMVLDMPLAPAQPPPAALTNQWTPLTYRIVAINLDSATPSGLR